MVRKADGKTPSLLGRALVKQNSSKKNEKRRKGAQNNSIYHNATVEDSEEASNLQSIMERNALDEFLNTAIMKEQSFAASKQSIIMVGGSTVVAVQEKKHLEELEYESIRIPRRPKWDFEMAADELQRLEREAFLDWRRSLAKYEESTTEKTATPFEKNIEVWKQLWRVVERSHVISQVVDARNPLLYYCEDLFTLAKELDPRKSCIVVINKSDFLTEEARRAWANYFTEKNIKFIFWSAKIQQEVLDIHEEKQKQREALRMEVIEAARIKAKKQLHAARLAKLKAQEDSKVNENGEDIEDEDTEMIIDPSKKRTLEDTIDSEDNDEMILNKLKVLELDDHEDSDSDEDIIDNIDEAVDFDHLLDHKLLKHLEDEDKKPIEEYVDMGSRDPTRIVAFQELLDYYKYIANMDYVNESRPSLNDPTAKAKVVVGMVGFPNVGKSSTINALMGAKKVSVSSTAGHTKHFQTLNLGDDIMLCDCPGLVFPTFVHSKATLVINGVIPIDTLRDFISPVEAICTRISRSQITQLYGLNIPRWKQMDAITLLESYATLRGFYKDKGRPDESRSARIILKDFVAGKLLYCQTPPNLTEAQRSSFYKSFSEALKDENLPTNTSMYKDEVAPLGHNEIVTENPDVINVEVQRKKVVTVVPEVDTVTVTREKTKKERLEELANANLTKKQLLRMRNNLLKGKGPDGSRSGARILGGTTGTEKFYGRVISETGAKIRPK